MDGDLLHVNNRKKIDTDNIFFWHSRSVCEVNHMQNAEDNSKVIENSISYRNGAND